MAINPDQADILARQHKQEQRAGRDQRLLVQDMEGAELLVFLLALFFGLGTGKDGIGSNESLRELAGNLGIDANKFTGIVENFRSGKFSAIQAAQASRNVANVAEADIDAARATIEKYGGADNPLLELIGQKESRGNYNVVYGGKTMNLTSMTINDVIAWQRDFTGNQGSPSSAAGKYQIIRKTLEGLKAEMGLSGDEQFNEAMQDRMAYQLLARRGYDKYLAGEMDEATFMRKLSQEWASFPKDSSGRSYYAGDGLNKALVSPATVLATMRMAKEHVANPDAPGAFAGDPDIRAKFDPEALSVRMIQISRTDDAKGGFCAKGVANILENLGIPHERGDAHQWKNTLPQNGWIKLDGINPEDAPPGAVLIYDRNADLSKVPKSDRGGPRFGHIEMKALNADGNNIYVSDKARSNWGGRVPKNFIGAWVHPSMYAIVDGKPVPNETAVAAVNTAALENAPIPTAKPETTAAATGTTAAFAKANAAQAPLNQAATAPAEQPAGALTTAFAGRTAAGASDNPEKRIAAATAELAAAANLPTAPKDPAAQAAAALNT